MRIQARELNEMATITTTVVFLSHPLFFALSPAYLYGLGMWECSHMHAKPFFFHFFLFLFLVHLRPCMCGNDFFFRAMNTEHRTVNTHSNDFLFFFFFVVFYDFQFRFCSNVLILFAGSVWVFGSRITRLGWNCVLFWFHLVCQDKLYTRHCNNVEHWMLNVFK